MQASAVILYNKGRGDDVFKGNNMCVCEKS